MSQAVHGVRSAFYDDSGFNYMTYWSGRDYEHQSEVIALRRLLSGQRFECAADIGGGYGRLSAVLSEYAGTVTLADPSSQQLELAEGFLAGHARIELRLMEAASLDFPDASLDLVAMVRVMHHLPDPSAELAEVVRVLRPDGTAIIEVANVAHAVNRLRYLARGERVPMAAVDIRSPGSREKDGIPFVNHHPVTIARQFRAAGLRIERVLSVSNLRHPLVKRAFPGRSILVAERMAQVGLARIQFGPSLFYLLRRQAGPARAPGQRPGRRHALSRPRAQDPPVRIPMPRRAS